MNEDKRLELKKEIAKGLLDIEAVFLRPEDPFTWASGIKSPIYCDNRLILTAPKVRDKVEQSEGGRCGGSDLHRRKCH